MTAPDRQEWFQVVERPRLPTDLELLARHQGVLAPGEAHTARRPGPEPLRPPRATPGADTGPANATGSPQVGHSNAPGGAPAWVHAGA